MGFETPLFRPEAIEHRKERLHGNIHISIPMSWQVIGWVLFCGLAVAAGFLATASYARIETAPGTIVLDKGLAEIVPSHPGIVTVVAATEGQHVRAGDPLIRIRSGEYIQQGQTAPERMRAGLSAQDKRLTGQAQSVSEAARAEREGRLAQISGLRGEIGSLDRQIDQQQRLVEVALKDFQSAQALAGRGYVTGHDLYAREAALVSRRQQLAQLQQARTAKLSNVTEAQRAIAQAAANASAQVNRINSDRAQLEQQLAQAEAQQGYTLVAPIEGVVTAVTARPGQPADRQPLMMIVPAHAQTRAELYVPTAAAGFLKVGQPVRLAIDAFPYQTFGTVKARIWRISSAVVPRANGRGGSEPVYLVTATIDDLSVTAFGRKQPLLPGMMLTARIVTARESLLERLFEPMFAVSRR
jgi:membrane fusion protein